MSSEKATARAVGALFIIATATAIVGGTLLLPLDETNYLAAVADALAQMATGALLEIGLVLSVVGIAVLLFPVLRRRNEGLALGYVGVRILEGTLLLAAALSAIVVLGLSQEEAPAGARPIGDVALAAREWTYLIGSVVMFGVSTLVLYPLLYVARLVPAWLSLWGLAGGALILGRGLLDLYGVEFSALWLGLLAAPIAINEMVLAVWLIVKGFSVEASSATAADAAVRRNVPASQVSPGGG